LINLTTSIVVDVKPRKANLQGGGGRELREREERDILS
jgi:hypothetical protein